MEVYPSSSSPSLPLSLSLPSLTSLPGDILRLLASRHLTFPQIYQVARTSKYLYSNLYLSTASTYWKTLFIRFLSEVRVPSQEIRQKFLQSYKIRKLPLARQVRIVAKLGYEKVLQEYFGHEVIIFSHCCHYAHSDLVASYFEKLKLLSFPFHSIIRRGYNLACGAGSLDIVRFLSTRVEYNLNILDIHRPVSMAAYSGNLELLEYLFSLEMTDLDAALYGAARGKKLNIITYLLDRGADNYEIGLYGAAASNSIEFVKYFEFLGATNYTKALLSATAKNARVSMEYLLGRGARVTPMTIRNIALLNDLPLLERYVKHASRYSESTSYSTALHESIQKKYWKIAKYLLQIGVYSITELNREILKVDEIDLLNSFHDKFRQLVPVTLYEKRILAKYPNNLLISAARRGSRPIIDKSFEMGATDILGALQVTLSIEGRDEIQNYLLTLAQQQELDVERTYSRALEVAISFDRDEVIDKLLQRGTSITSSAVCSAVRQNNFPILLRLLSLNPVDINCAVQLAVRRNSLESLRILLSSKYPLTSGTVNYIIERGSVEVKEIVAICKGVVFAVISVTN